MPWDWTIKITDIAIVLATGAGPVLAVQAQKVLEKRREVAERRSTMFRSLMATRATTLSPVHVEAFNAVPVEFYGPGNKRLKGINDAWHSYLDHLNLQGMEPALWASRRQELLVEFLFSMSQYLGYDFNKSEIGKDVYYPTGHVNIESDQEMIRRGFVQLLKGEISLPMAVKEFPADDKALEGQVELHKMLREWLEGERTVKIDASGD